METELETESGGRPDDATAAPFVESVEFEGLFFAFNGKTAVEASERASSFLAEMSRSVIAVPRFLGPGCDI